MQRLPQHPYGFFRVLSRNVKPQLLHKRTDSQTPLLNICSIPSRRRVIVGTEFLGPLNLLFIMFSLIPDTLDFPNAFVAHSFTGTEKGYAIAPKNHFYRSNGMQWLFLIVAVAFRFCLSLSIQIIAIAEIVQRHSTAPLFCILFAWNSGKNVFSLIAADLKVQANDIWMPNKLFSVISEARQIINFEKRFWFSRTDAIFHGIVFQEESRTGDRKCVHFHYVCEKACVIIDCSSLHVNKLWIFIWLCEYESRVIFENIGKRHITMQQAVGKHLWVLVTRCRMQLPHRCT